MGRGHIATNGSKLRDITLIFATKNMITDKKEVEDIHGARETCNKIKGRILGLEEGILFSTKNHCYFFLKYFIFI